MFIHVVIVGCVNATEMCHDRIYSLYVALALLLYTWYLVLRLCR